MFAMVRGAGGFSPPERTRSERSLTREDREEITRGLAAGDSLRAIASRIGRSPATVSREVSRNGGRGRYRAGDSDDAAFLIPLVVMPWSFAPGIVSTRDHRL